MFLQYNLSDPTPATATIRASTTKAVDSGALADAGCGQLEVLNDTDMMQNAIDITQNPPVLVSLV